MAVDKSKAYVLREQGHTLKEIAKELGCSETHIRTILSGVPKGIKYDYSNIELTLLRISKELQELVKSLGK